MEKLSPEARASRKKTIWLLAEAALFFGGLAACLIWMASHFMSGANEEARLSRVKNDFEMLTTYIRMFQSSHHRLPTAEEGLAVFVRQPKSWLPSEKWRRLMDEPLRDPWRREYRYEALLDAQGYRLRSLGPDKNSADDDIILTWPKQSAKVRTPAP